MSADALTPMAQPEPLTRAQRERQLHEAMQSDPMQVYAAYLRVFGTGDADAPTLTPREMVRRLVDHEFAR